jgi:rRNA maturation protein Nop10
MFQNLRRVMGEAQTLKIRCETCGHEAAWSQAEAFRWLGPDATPYTIRRKLVCSLCGGRAEVTI